MKAVVFDMDGVIVDSEAQWRACAAVFYRSAAPGLRPEHLERLTGMGVEDSYHFLSRECGLAMTKAEFSRHGDRIAREVYLVHATCAEGFINFVRDLRRRGVKTAIASSSPARWAALVLDRFELRPLLDAVVTADDVGQRTKPRPDLYVEAAARLGLPPADCLAIEDSEPGVLAAKRAGMKIAAFRNGHNDEQDLSLAEFALDGFAALDYESLMARLKRR